MGAGARGPDQGEEKRRQGTGRRPIERHKCNETTLTCIH
jgi:hypothetical protein